MPKENPGVGRIVFAAADGMDAMRSAEADNVQAYGTLYFEV